MSVKDNSNCKSRHLTIVQSILESTCWILKKEVQYSKHINNSIILTISPYVLLTQVVRTKELLHKCSARISLQYIYFIYVSSYSRFINDRMSVWFFVTFMDLNSLFLHYFSIFTKIIFALKWAQFYYFISVS